MLLFFHFVNVEYPIHLQLTRKTTDQYKQNRILKSIGIFVFRYYLRIPFNEKVKTVFDSQLFGYLPRSNQLMH